MPPFQACGLLPLRSSTPRPCGDVIPDVRPELQINYIVSYVSTDLRNKKNRFDLLTEVRLALEIGAILTVKTTVRMSMRFLMTV